MYDLVADRDCYLGTTVLKNLVDLKSTEVLGRFEAMANNMDTVYEGGNLEHRIRAMGG